MNINSTITIFGATGDLTYRKLMPALYNLISLKTFSNTSKIIAIGRKTLTKNEYLAIIKPYIQQYARLAFNEEDFQKFSEYIEYFQMEITQPEQYRILNEYYEMHKLSYHLYYLAVAPQLFQVIIQGLTYIARVKESKVIIEKPFGVNMQDAYELNQKLEKLFRRENIYHIDHYLGKEMIQNVQSIRFKNTIFKNLWNHESIQQIQISALEKEGIHTRGSYYDTSGALKDMVESHLLQILAMLTMEEKENIREASLDVLKHLQLDPKDIILGQYEGYLEEKDVADDSITPTYAALRLTSSLPQWEGVDFYLRTGKKMNKNEIEAIIQFKAEKQNPANVLQIKIQPNEGVYLQFNIKKPGSKHEIETVKMDFCQCCVEINRINTPQAYEYLLLAALNSESQLFTSWDEIKEAHRLFEDVELPQPVVYPQNSDKILESDQLLAKRNHYWIEIKHD